jgi:hypothetical protein
MIMALVVPYLIFFFFWLPIIIYQFLMSIGRPGIIWDRLFERTAMATDFLIPEFNESRAQLFLHYVHIGIPFSIFSLILILLILAFSPLGYFMFSPIGLGSLGICLDSSLHFPHSRETDLISRGAKSYKWEVFVHAYALAMTFAIISIAQLSIPGVTSYGCLLGGSARRQFAIDLFPSVWAVLGRSSMFQD